MEYFKEYNRIANWIHRFSLCVRNKNFISSKTRVLLQKYERNFNPACACVRLYLLNTCLHFISIFSPENFEKIKFRIYRRYAYSDRRKIDLSTEDFVFTKFSPQFRAEARTTRAIEFYSKKLFNFSLRS